MHSSRRGMRPGHIGRYGAWQNDTSVRSANQVEDGRKARIRGVVLA